MSEKSLADLLRRDKESFTLEFKSEIKLSDSEKSEFAKDVSSFANAKGGNILYGKDDPKRGGKIVGIDPKSFNSEKMYQIISQKCYPPVKFKAELLSFESKSFILLTIPESPLKPHEIVGTRDVWIRRGDTTDKATTREIMLMHDEARKMQESIEAENQLSEETSLEAFEGRALLTAILSSAVLIYMPICLWAFWALGKSGGFSIRFSIEALPSSIVLWIIIWGIIWFARSLGGRDILRKIIYLMRKVLVPYLASLSMFVLGVAILNISIFLYPDSISVYFEALWLDFLVVCMMTLGLAFVTIAVSYLFMTQYFAKLEDPDYARDPMKDVKRLILEWKQWTKFLRNKFSACAMLGLLLLTAIIVPIDIRFGLFTPSIREGKEEFSHAFYDVSDVNFLFLYSDRITPTTILSECRFYRLAQRQYVIYPAKIPLLSAICIPNPTNISVGGTGNPSIGATSSDKSTKNLGSVYVTIDNQGNVNHSFVPTSYNFTHIEFESPGVYESFVANVSYWRFVENLNISVTTESQYSNLGNGTWLETYTFTIMNNEAVPLEIMTLDFDRFIDSVVNITTTKAYSQGGEWYTNFVYLRRRLGIWLRIGPEIDLNLTITFQSSDIT